MALRVTNKLDTVTGDVTRDIPTATAAKNVVPDILGWIAKSYVADSVYTMNDVTMLVEFVPEVVLTGILDDIATFLANLGIMVETVLYLVPPTVRHVDTQMNVFSPMEKTVSIRAVDNALTRHVIDSTETVCVMANVSAEC